jgi:hypothetical protein
MRNVGDGKWCGSIETEVGMVIEKVRREGAMAERTRQQPTVVLLLLLLLLLLLGCHGRNMCSPDTSSDDVGPKQASQNTKSTKNP